MDDVRCPMCGKTNPAGAETCQYCQARLKPLVISNPNEEAGKAPIPGADANPEDSVPDWLRALRNDNDASQPGSDAEEESLFSEEEANSRISGTSGSEYDWLRGINMPGTVTPDAQDQRPAWEFTQEVPSIPEVPSQPEASENEPLDASSGHAQESQPGAPEEDQAGQFTFEQPPADETPFKPVEPAPEPAEGAEAEPDWLQRIRERQRLDQEEVQAPEQAAAIPEEPAATLDEWLASLRTEPKQEPPHPEPADLAPTEEPQPEETPDWLSGPSPFDIPEIPAETPVETIPAGETPVSVHPEEPELPSEIPADLNNIPDWLSTVAPQETSAPIESSTTPEAGSQPEDIAPAELPGWLNSMRPVESVTPATPVDSAPDSLVESAGPLAGLAGVLGAESEITRFRKPPVHSVKLQVSENQQLNMRLLEDILATEGEAKPVPKRTSLPSLAILRLLIAAILVFAILAPMWFNGQFLAMPGPARISSNITDASYLIGTLPAGAPVLIAFDYEPGIAGEIEATSSAMIAQLAERGAFLTIVSTTPTGPLLGERLVQNLNQRAGSATTRYANFGYIPGGASGLLALAENPRLVLPYDLRSQDAWNSGPLMQVNHLADFALVMVLTEKPETARSWIEQVQPFLQAKKTPLVLVTSAQAEPMVRPYYEGNPRQVSGMVAGLAGGATYESLTGRPSTARTYWDSFGAGLLAAEILILFGGITYIAIALVSPRKKTEGEGAL